MFLEKEQVIINKHLRRVCFLINFSSICEVYTGLNIPPLPNKKQKDKQYFKKRTFYI